MAENGKQYDQDVTKISPFKSVFLLKQIVFSVFPVFAVMLI